ITSDRWVTPRSSAPPHVLLPFSSLNIYSLFPIHRFSHGEAARVHSIFASRSHQAAGAICRSAVQRGLGTSGQLAHCPFSQFSASLPDLLGRHYGDCLVCWAAIGG